MLCLSQRFALPYCRYLPFKTSVRRYSSPSPLLPPIAMGKASNSEVKSSPAHPKDEAYLNSVIDKRIKLFKEIQDQQIAHLQSIAGDSIKVCVMGDHPPPTPMNIGLNLRPGDQECAVTAMSLQCQVEIKKINDEKKASMAVQFATEATLRRVHAAQKDDDMSPIEVILSPLEAELKLTRDEIAKLQDDNKALDRLTKSLKVALL